MVRSELLQKLCNLHPNITRNDLEKILIIILSEITNSLCEGKNIEIRGFGTYKIVNRKARIGRNPKTLEIYEINERSVIIFKTSNYLKLQINTFND